MGSRKEDERNEATIRRLLKLPENKRCINCNSVGPQYVCTTFCTFVCTQCSGIHREFSHRIKSISMAKFAAAEVSALQAGGNERARQFFFKSMAQNTLPDSGSPDQLRKFIERVYEKRLYAGDRPPSPQQEETAVDSPRLHSNMEGPPNLRRLSVEDHLGKHSFNKRNSDFGKLGSPRSIGSPKSLGSPRAVPRPTRLSYDDRDERLEMQSQKSCGRESRTLSRPVSFRDFDSTPPPPQSITDILGDVPGLRVEVFKNSNDVATDSPRVSQGSSVGARKAWQSQSFGAVGDDRVTPVTLAHKRINSASLINIGEGNGATGISHVEDPFPGAPQSTSSNNDNWATFSTTPTLATPAGSPSLKSEDSAWADPGWVKQTSTLDTWSSFESSSASQETPKQERFTAISRSVSQSSSGFEPSPRHRRQDFFATSFEAVNLPNSETHPNQQVQTMFHPQISDDTLESDRTTGQQGGLSGSSENFQVQCLQTQAKSLAPAPASSSVLAISEYQIQHQPQIRLQPLEQPQQMPVQTPITLQRSRNPFDDDFEDDSSTSLASSAVIGNSLQFPSMDSLQAALLPTMQPQASRTHVASPEWGHSFSQFTELTTPSESFKFGPNETASPFQMPLFTMQPNASGGYMPTHSMVAEAPYPGNQFYTHNVVLPAGGNPFA
ncbi:uncharacterized protein [Physcomitrium patens]|uniref:uncharacterized protein isoform X3 n=1 Tax=Physcomitrium patens TaxID=3218 RepID=UPI000D1582F2|nr:probable ADP-ribosylation factor GTPase-activating protein AGD14 isoform X3 [Physcomitrium patens]|eukprot:XP_024394716.1 probable ADP-ribosylation factor GTPase-activating protein AGD14 isoform X3 [Physcomitrella patens]